MLIHSRYLTLTLRDTLYFTLVTSTSPEIAMNTYTVQGLATLAGVSVRTLHHYDAIGLLQPAHRDANNYRQYGEAELLRLQQILFFRELDMPLDQIQRTLDSAQFDILHTLEDHKAMLGIQKKRIHDLLHTIDKTIKKITNESMMNDDELYDGFSKEELDAWNKEAKERWGDTDMYKQSVGKYESLTKEEKLKMKHDGEALMDEIVLHMDKGASSPEVQALVQRHYDSLRFFYEPNLTMYRGLADMYVGYQGDTRFRAYFEKHHNDLPEFMHDAIHIFCDTHQ